MTLYNLKRSATGYIMAKFDDDLNVAAVYTLRLPERGHWQCDCPAGPRPSCRHRKMLDIFSAAQAIDSIRFYDYETQMWHQPFPILNEAEASSTAAKAAEAAGPVVGSESPSQLIRRI